jgi:hypothetical protein
MRKEEQNPHQGMACKQLADRELDHKYTHIPSYNQYSHLIREMILLFFSILSWRRISEQLYQVANLNTFALCCCFALWSLNSSPCSC